jgi:hypothetical protein
MTDPDEIAKKTGKAVCKVCGYIAISTHPAEITNHLRAQHPEFWTEFGELMESLRKERPEEFAAFEVMVAKAFPSTYDGRHRTPNPSIDG